MLFEEHVRWFLDLRGTNTYTSVLTMHSTLTKSSFTTCKPPFHNFATISSHRVLMCVYRRLWVFSADPPPVASSSAILISISGGGGGAVAFIANSRSFEEMSSPAMRVGCMLRSSLGVYVGEGGVVTGVGGRMSCGGGDSHGAGWQSVAKS